MIAKQWVLSSALLAACLTSLGAAWFIRSDGQAASAQTAASVGFSPASSTLVLGATPVPTVDVSVSNVSGVAGYDAWVTFNGSVVQLSNLQDAGFLANPNAQGTPQNLVACGTPTVTPSYGHIACSILPLPSPFPPPVLPSAGSTPAALVHASFNPVAGGTSPLGQSTTVSGTPETTTLLDINNTPMAANLGSGSITVKQSVGGITEEPDLAALPEQATPLASHAGALYAAAILSVAAAVAIGWVAIAAWRRRARAR